MSYLVRLRIRPVASMRIRRLFERGRIFQHLTEVVEKRYHPQQMFQHSILQTYSGGEVGGGGGAADMIWVPVYTKIFGQ